MKHPIVILHGWGLSAKTFFPLVSELRKNHFQVFAPDFPGFDAEHIPNRPLTLADYADYLQAYLQKHNIACPIIIGHSFGGRVALKYQEHHEISGLILTGTPGVTPIPRKKLMLFIAVAKIGGLFMSIPILRSAKNKVRLWYYYTVGARDFYRAEGVMRETFKNVVKEPLVSCMKAIQVPTLLVWGQNDIIVPLRVAYKMKEIIPKADLKIIPGFGHDVPFVNAKKFVTTIYDFLRSLS
jgi:pimeloyl-ACP methyl ester carboxylesterase